MRHIASRLRHCIVALELALTGVLDVVTVLLLVLVFAGVPVFADWLRAF